MRRAWGIGIALAAAIAALAVARYASRDSAPGGGASGGARGAAEAPSPPTLAAREGPAERLLRGTVVRKDDGRPVPDAVVSLRNASNEEVTGGDDAPLRTLTAADGSYALLLPPDAVLSAQGPSESVPGPHGELPIPLWVVARHARYLESDAVGVGRADGRIGEVALRLEEGATLSGAVTGPDGRPPASATVVVTDADDGTHAGEADARGRYEVTGLPQGEARVEVAMSLDGDGPSLRLTATVMAQPPGRRSLDFDARAGTVVAGRVLRGSSPAAAVSVYAKVPSAVEPESVERAAGAETDEEGRFRLFLPAGTGDRVAVEAVDFHGAYRLLAPAERAGEREVVLVLPDGRIRGRVTARGDGRPLADVRVDVASAQEGGRNTFTDPEGRYAFEGLPAGAYRVAAGRDLPRKEVRTDDLLPSDWQFVDVVEGTPAAVDLALDEGGSVRVRVLDARGAPVPSLHVGRVGDADEEGVAVRRGVRPGTLRPWVAEGVREVYGAVEVVAGRASEVDLVVPWRPWAKVRCRVVGSDAREPSDVRFDFQAEESRPMPAWRRQRSHASFWRDEQGSFVAHLFGGRYHGSIVAADHAPWRGTIDVRPGEPKEIEVRLEAEDASRKREDAEDGPEAEPR